MNIRKKIKHPRRKCGHTTKIISIIYYKRQKVDGWQVYIVSFQTKIFTLLSNYLPLFLGLFAVVNVRSGLLQVCIFNLLYLDECMYMYTVIFP